MPFHIFMQLEKDWSNKTIQKLWEDHRRIDRKYLDRLDGKYAREAASLLCKDGLEPELGLLLAEELAIIYLSNFEAGLSGQRTANRLSELSRFKKAIIELQKALSGLSESTIYDLSYKVDGSFDDYLAKKPEAIFRAKISQDYFYCWEDTDSVSRVEPGKMSELKILENACTSLISSVQNKDHGGPISGEYDSSGANAKKRLVYHILYVLKRLGLPHGSQKGGPLAKMITLIHGTAFGTDAKWANRYAAMGPKLSREWMRRHTSAP